LSESAKSPYTTTSNRLANVIAAIQAMSVYKFHMCTFETWAENIGGDASTASYWKLVFQEHPEFFRLDTTRQRASLVWRRQLPKHFDVDSGELLSEKEVDALTQPEQKRLSRGPLSPSETKTLIDTAISLHSSAVELQRENRWWIPLVSSLIGGLIGALVGTFFRHS
jgi:hypothetical protein